jgi:hypothetical protein
MKFRGFSHSILLFKLNLLRFRDVLAFLDSHFPKAGNGAGDGARTHDLNLGKVAL